MNRQYLILSLKHSPCDGLLMWWRPHNQGYTTRLEEAGMYMQSEINEAPDYYNNDSTMAVPIDVATRMAKLVVPDSCLRDLQAAVSESIQSKEK